jgi:hypothetical protein
MAFKRSGALVVGVVDGIVVVREVGVADCEVREDGLLLQPAATTEIRTPTPAASAIFRRRLSRWTVGRAGEWSSCAVTTSMISIEPNAHS